MLNLLGKLAAIGNDDLLGGFATLAAKRLYLLHHIHAFNHTAEHHMLSIKPRSK